MCFNQAPNPFPAAGSSQPCPCLSKSPHSIPGSLFFFLIFWSGESLTGTSNLWGLNQGSCFFCPQPTSTIFRNTELQEKSWYRATSWNAPNMFIQMIKGHWASRTENTRTEHAFYARFCAGHCVCTTSGYHLTITAIGYYYEWRPGDLCLKKNRSPAAPRPNFPVTSYGHTEAVRRWLERSHRSMSLLSSGSWIFVLSSSWLDSSFVP